MRILVWSQYFWPEIFRINELTASLVRFGQSVTVLTGKPNYPEGRFFDGYRGSGFKRETFNGAKVVRIPMLPRGDGSSFRLLLNYLAFVVSGYLFAPLALRRQRFDLVFVYAPSPLLQALPALMLALLKRAPLVVWVQDLWPEALSATGHVKNKLVLRFVEVLVRHIYRRADSILIQSEAFRAPVARLAGCADKIRFFPNSADLLESETCGSDRAQRLAQEMRERFAIVFAGNIGNAQAMDTIVEAADRLRMRPEIGIYIVGAGSRAEWVEEEIQRRKLENMYLPGSFPATDMPAILAAASGLLLTLRNDPVGLYTMPSKLQAYMAAGRPILACVNGEAARVVEEAKAGLTCAAEDAEGLAEAMLRLWRMSEDERMRLGQNGHRYFMEHYEATRLTGELIAHFESCVLGKRGGSQ